jgi:hypothetical protein
MAEVLRGADDAPLPTSSAPPPDSPLDVASLRHPTEASRFALALLASTFIVSLAVFLLVSLGQASQLLLLLLAITVTLVLFRLFVQLLRIRLLADGILVSSETLPRVQEVVDTVRNRLGYDKRVDVFVVDKVSRVLGAEAAPIMLTSFFGVNVIVAEGDALGDLSSEQERRQLVFLLATYIGALKARHTQWTPWLMALEMTGLPKLVFLFVYPWLRATVYTGDRIAYACCGDLDVSLRAVYQVLVGKNVAPHLRAPGLVGQAMSVRRGRLLRLVQLLRQVPHATNRYLDLLSFVDGREPAAFEAYRATLGPSAKEVDTVLARLRRRRPITVAAPLSAGVCGLMLVSSVVFGLQAQNSELARALSPAVGGGSVSPTVYPAPKVTTETPSTDTPTTDTPSTDTPTTDTPTQAPSYAQALIAMVPQDLRKSCTESTTDSTDQVAVVNCSQSGSADPATIQFAVYTSTAAMHAAFDESAAGLTGGDCSTGDAHRTTWTNTDNIVQGPLACYISADQETTVVWGTDGIDVLGSASDPSWTSERLLTWWQAHAELAP